MTTKILGLLAVGLLAGPLANAAIVDSADIAGYRTFQDTSTGRVWLDLNNFFDLSPNQMIAAASAAGFKFALRSDVEQLLTTLPLGGTAWTSYASIMGDAPNRNLIWGVFNDGSAPFGMAFAYDSYAAWSIYNDVADANVIQNEGTGTADMNIWAYREVPSVPEPGTLALLGLGLAGLRVSRRRKAV